MLNLFNITIEIENDNIYLYHFDLSDLELFKKIFGKQIQNLFVKREKYNLFFSRYIIPTTFLFELGYLLYIAYKVTNIGKYKNAFFYILQNTDLSKRIRDDITVHIDSDKANKNFNPKYKMLSYQEEFINYYLSNKEKKHLRGVFLAFDQGLGKTFTSLALSLFIKSEQVVIICPNALKSMWHDAVKDVFKKYYTNDETFNKEVYTYEFSKDNRANIKNKRFVIINYESLNKLYSDLDKKKSKYFIMDESHNLKELNSSRTRIVFDLISKYNVIDALCQSGTPIKGKVHEVLPIIYLLDKSFTQDTLKLYKKIISENVNILALLNYRFNYLAFRKTKIQVGNVIKLPDKVEIPITVDLKNVERYTIQTVKQDMSDYIKKYIEKEEPNIDQYRTEINNIIFRVRKLDPFINEQSAFYIQALNRMRAGDLLNPEEKQLKIEFEKNLLRLLRKQNKIDDKEFIKLNLGKANQLYSSAVGKAISEVYMKRYREMIGEFAEVTIPDIKEILNRSIPGKVVILSSFPDITKKLSDKLNSLGYKSLYIIGEVSNEERAKNIQAFKEDPEVKFLCGTLEIMYVGFTLVVSDSLLFLSDPWRWTDKRQGEDRIYRIGQVNTAKIYTLKLNSNEPTLNDRKNEIIDDSEYIFKSIIGD